ncbi:hypothetical protein MOLA814_00682 [Betaproteobacteria bacterium MOLA814]|nr:hypothetical protein MOLA814_00682 [Betaproteobacteria bacterium MOLA814]
MIFILSAQFVGESLRAEVGDLPVSFVPLANRRLYAYQVEIMRLAFPARPIMITLPEGFTVSEAERVWMKEHGVDVLTLKGDGGTGEELSEVLAKYCSGGQGVTFLLGGCLPLEVPSEPDMIGVFETDLEPELPVEAFGTERDVVWAGIFSVSKPDLLASCLNEESKDYFRAIKRYSFRQKVAHSRIDRCFILTNATCYFHARSSFTTERAFNRLKIEHTVLKKFSGNAEKIRAEAHWFDHTPLPLRKFTPQYLGDGLEDDAYFYSIEYLGAIPLNESFVYGRQTIVFWERVFMKISSFLAASRSANVPACADGARSEALFVRKAHSRLDEFIRQTGFDADSELFLNCVCLPSLRQILADSSEHLMTLGDVPAFVHGDLCLSNILYDSRMRAIKLIDPRGADEDGQRMVYGSQLYDVAKLAHSILGLYDHIVAGQYALSVDGQHFTFRIFGAEDVEEIQSAFRRHSFVPGLCARSIEKTLPLLFIAMLPLHADSVSRQTALLANAMRLYAGSFEDRLN